MKDQIIEYFHNVPLLSGLSNQAIVKINVCFKLFKMKKAGQYIAREGEPVSHVIFVKDGEFELVKKDLKGLDERLLSFLRKGNIRKKIA